MTQNDLETATSHARAVEYERHQLQADGVSPAGAIVMAVAGSAPAYSIAATTATLVGVAGLGAPGALLWAGLPMLGIAWAFLYLGRVDVQRRGRPTHGSRGGCTRSSASSPAGPWWSLRPSSWSPAPCRRVR